MRIDELAELKGISVAELEKQLREQDVISLELKEGRSRAAKDRISIELI